MRDAVDALAAVYVSALSRLARARRLRVLVHPVPPTLPETRAVVAALNAALRARVPEAAAALRRAAGGDGGIGGGGGGGGVGVGVPSLHWLEFESALLEAPAPACPQAGGRAEGRGGAARGEPPRLRPEFVLDGTHLAPAYLPVLQRALDRVG
jgi:hypothetical protein